MVSKRTQRQKKYIARLRGKLPPWEPKYKDSVLDRQSAYQIRKKYGIKVDEYETLLKAQNGKCAICGRHYTELGKLLSVDHDHESGKNRSLLCNGCNLGLGNFEENISNLKKAINYLKKWGK